MTRTSSAPASAIRTHGSLGGRCWRLPLAFRYLRMTLAIAHRDKFGYGILDCIREVRPPFSPESVVDEFCTVLKQYRLTRICGDRYAGEWPAEQFAKRNITYEPSERVKSDIYRDMLPLLNSRKVQLLDDRRLISQLHGLERRTARGGKDSIDHGPGAHDDVANSIAGALVLASGRVPFVITDAVLQWAGQPALAMQREFHSFEGRY